MMRLILNWAAGMGAALAAALATARADDFRVQTQVFVGDAEKPSSENLTLFHGGLVYDFMLTEPKEVAIFRPADDKFELLAPVRKQQTELSTGSLTAENEKARQRALRSKSELAKFLANPKFEQKFDVESGQFTFESNWVSYVIQSERAANSQIARQYREFSDWFARVNSASRRLTPLPYARIAVGDYMFRRERLPREVVLKVHDGDSSKVVKRQFRSAHVISATITPEDLALIATIPALREKCGKVEPATYLRAAADEKE